MTPINYVCNREEALRAMNLCAPHNCHCGAKMDASGYHGPSCRRSAGRHPRHSQINDIINLALGRADIPAMKEPSGLVVGSAVRPVGVTLIPWIRGRCLAWDATTPDTFAASHFARTSSPAGAAASHAAEAKI